MTREIEIEEMLRFVSHNGITIEQNVQQLVSLAGRVALLRTAPGEPLYESGRGVIDLLVAELNKAGDAITDGHHGVASEHLANVLAGVGLLAYGSNLSISREFLETLMDGLYRPVAAND